MSLLGFSLFPQITFQRFQKLVRIYQKDYQSAWANLNRHDLEALRLDTQDIDYILAQKKKIDLARYLAEVEQNGMRLIDYYGEEYPDCLREIYNPPLVLYGKGPLNLKTVNGLAVVGTRRATPYGLKAADLLVAACSGQNFTIVSGMALGIDTAAHQAALKYDLPTIAVMGTGLDNIYPVENRKLFAAIAERGLVLSEYPLKSKPEKWHFPKRNRIITGLSRTVFILEGDLKSGAMISGQMALEQNRDVYALPGSIFSTASNGPNWLIAQGARPLLSPEDAINELVSGVQLAFRPAGTLLHDLSEEQEYFYSLIPAEGSLTLDDLVEISQKTLAQCIQLAVQLELKGVISQLPGKRLVRV